MAMALTGSEFNIPIPIAQRTKAKPRRGRKRPAEVDISNLLAQLNCEFAQEEEVVLNGSGLGGQTTFLKFVPSLNIQRFYRAYEILREIISSLENNNVKHPKTIMEVGCAQFGMHTYLNKIRSVERLIYIDANKELLKKHTKSLSPPLERRETPLQVQVFGEDFINLNPTLLNVQGKSIFGALALDVVEYFDLKNLELFTHMMFGTFAPSIVIITTPNSDFGCLFTWVHGDFRLSRPQWSRNEFEKWCNSVCQTYSTYSFTIEGIGSGPPGTEHIGCASQMAIFKKVDDMHEFSSTFPEQKEELFWNQSSEIEMDFLPPGHNQGHLEPLYEINYPYDSDQSSVEEKIVREFQSYISVYLLSPLRIEEYIQEERNQIEFPLHMILMMPGIPRGVTMEEIKNALRGANYKLLDIPYGVNQGTCVILPVPQMPNNDMEFSSPEETESEEEFHEGPIGVHENAQLLEDETW